MILFFREKKILETIEIKDTKTYTLHCAYKIEFGWENK